MLGVFFSFWLFLGLVPIEPSGHAALPQPQKKTFSSTTRPQTSSSYPQRAGTWILGGRKGPTPTPLRLNRQLPIELLPLQKQLLLSIETLKQILEARARVLSSPLGCAWEIEKKITSSRIDAKLYDQLQGRHFLFTAGFLNEFSKLQFEYFSVPINTLERTFCTTVQFYGPQSRRSTLDNVQPLYDVVTHAHAETGKPIVLIGHSKGGCEALFLSLRHPELILDGVLDRTVILQAPIQGVPFLRNKADHPLLRLAGCLFGDGLSCLQPDQAQTSLEMSFDMMQEKLKKVARHGPKGIEDTLHRWMSERIFFVRSSTPAQNRHRILQLFLDVLQFDPDEEGPNDGILALSAQSTPLIGTDLGWVEADHLDLVSGVFDTEDASNVAAFHRALWCTLFSEPSSTSLSMEHQAIEWLDSLSVFLEPTIQP